VTPGLKIFLFHRELPFLSARFKLNCDFETRIQENKMAYEIRRKNGIFIHLTGFNGRVDKNMPKVM
jgi:hypothetical protein